MSRRNTALVVGATGMIGRPLAERLAAAGWEVYGTARRVDGERGKAMRDAGIEPLAFEITEDEPAELPDVDAVFLEVWDPARADLIWPINFYGVERLVERYAGRAVIVNGWTITV